MSSRPASHVSAMPHAQRISASVGSGVVAGPPGTGDARSRPGGPGDDNQARRAMTKWEYATVPLIVHATKQILDQWGEDGYELVQVVPGPDNNGLVAYLKRPKA